jgi:hypothetical protein
MTEQEPKARTKQFALRIMPILTASRKSASR